MMGNPVEVLRSAPPGPGPPGEGILIIPINYPGPGPPGESPIIRAYYDGMTASLSFKLTMVSLKLHACGAGSRAMVRRFRVLETSVEAPVVVNPTP